LVTRLERPDPARRFQVLFDKVDRGDVLDRTWEQVHRDHGAAGIGQTTWTGDAGLMRCSRDQAG
jgi:hypothetical protein